MIFPYLGNIGLYREYLTGLYSGNNQCDNITELNPASLTRTELHPANHESMNLKVPLTGGSHTCKSYPPESWTISGHGRWPQVHLGALNAIYSQTPYYSHYIDRLTTLIEHAPGRNFAEFSADIHEWIMDAVAIRENVGIISNLSAEMKGLIGRRAHEMSGGIDARTSVVEALFRFGRETIFMLCSPLFEKF